MWQFLVDIKYIMHTVEDMKSSPVLCSLHGPVHARSRAYRATHCTVQCSAVQFASTCQSLFMKHVCRTKTKAKESRPQYV